MDLHSSAVESFSMLKQTYVAWEDKTRGRKDKTRNLNVGSSSNISLERLSYKLHCREP